MTAELRPDGLIDLPHERRWRGQTRPVPGILALVRRDHELLLIRRVAPPYTGQWALVGGAWDFGETLARGAVREVHEESSLDTEFVALRGVVNERLHPLGESDAGGHWLLFVCEVRILGGDAAEQAEGPVAWFDSPGLERLHTTGQIVPSDYVMIQEFLRAPAQALWHAELTAHAGEHGLHFFGRGA